MSEARVQRSEHRIQSAANRLMARGRVPAPASVICLLVPKLPDHSVPFYQSLSTA
jgi:hypothetical protein